MKDKQFKELVASMREAGAIVRGEKRASRMYSTDGPDIKRVRAGYRLSQGQFAALLGISPGTLRNWEQGRREPQGPARVLLQVAARHPEAVWDVVRAERAPRRQTLHGRKSKRNIRS
jgi:putative transcriptional regulator